MMDNFRLLGSRFTRSLNVTLDKWFGIRITKGTTHRGMDVEDAAWQIIRQCEDRTMCSFGHKYLMWQAVNYVETNSIDGAIAEFGVWRGGISMISSSVLRQRNSARPVFLFDTFEGMTEPGDNDKELSTRTSAARLLESEPRVAGRNNTWAYATLDDVKRGIASTQYSSEFVHYVVGDVVDTVPDNLPEKLAICRIDVDWYEPTKHVLAHCWPRISDGGLLILDDYDHWGGARLAVNEVLSGFEVSPLLVRLDSGRVIIKRSN